MAATLVQKYEEYLFKRYEDKYKKGQIKKKVHARRSAMQAAERFIRYMEFIFGYKKTWDKSIGTAHSEYLEFLKAVAPEEAEKQEALYRKAKLRRLYERG
ncbi:hypothetical protein [Persephonella sp.]